jgi:hypothetical protein
MTATATYPKSTECPLTWPVEAGALAAGENVDAISMPAAFGALVLAELDIMMLAGPVIADDHGSWLFLTERADARQSTVPADLLPLGVRVVPAGTPVAPADRPGRAPAIWWTVIGAARRVAHRAGRVACS